MDMNSVSLPEVYKESIDFRFFMEWIQAALTRIQRDTECFDDLYDPLRCPAELLWLLADTMGFRYDDRFITAFNRFVLKYFMDMISNRGSERGMTIAAEANLKQFELNLLAVTGYTDEHGQFVEPKDILADRLEDESIPVNTVSVVPHVDLGYIDVVYFSEQTPTDACLEYVRPVGMYINACAGVQISARNKVSVDARLVDDYDLLSQVGMNRVAPYSRADYARLQKSNFVGTYQRPTQGRNLAYPNNSTFQPASEDAGYRTLYSMQLCNNVQTVRGLIPGASGMIYDVEDVNDVHGKIQAANLKYNKTVDELLGTYLRTISGENQGAPVPAVNPVMTKMGDAISMNSENSEYYSTP